MRPVNLIPREERSGERRPMRGGPLAYVVVGALAAALIGVTLMVLTSNQISEREAEVTQLEAATAAAEAKANELAGYTEFHRLRQERVATVTSLADSRFDWERVMRELALILPGDVWLTNLTGTVSPAVAPESAASVALRGTVPGPALEIVGCARGQQAVAGFVQALKEIDGVTRVGVQESELGDNQGAGRTESVATGCPNSTRIAKFQLVAAFDAAPVPAASGEATVTSAPPPAAEAEGEGEATGEEGEAGAGGEES